MSEPAPMPDTASSIPYYDLVLGKEYIIKKDGLRILYKGTYYCHYRKTFDESDTLIFINVTPNPENKKVVEFNQSDEYYKTL
jgi:hypothetical protein